MNQFFETNQDENKPMQNGYRLYIDLFESGKFLRFEVVGVRLNQLEVDLLALDYPSFSHTVSVNQYYRYLHLSRVFVLRHGPVIACLKHNRLTIDGYLSELVE